jgi:uncharacterized protein (DUF342 family)
MTGAHLIRKMKELFGLTSDKESTKKRLKELIKKLKLRRITLKKELKDENDLVKREGIHDSIKIIKQQIKKGKEILDES